MLRLTGMIEHEIQNVGWDGFNFVVNGAVSD